MSEQIKSDNVEKKPKWWRWIYEQRTLKNPKLKFPLVSLTCSHSWDSIYATEMRSLGFSSLQYNLQVEHCVALFWTQDRISSFLCLSAFKGRLSLDSLSQMTSVFNFQLTFQRNSSEHWRGQNFVIYETNKMPSNLERALDSVDVSVHELKSMFSPGNLSTRMRVEGREFDAVVHHSMFPPGASCWKSCYLAGNETSHEPFSKTLR